MSSEPEQNLLSQTRDVFVRGIGGFIHMVVFVAYMTAPLWPIPVYHIAGFEQATVLALVIIAVAVWTEFLISD